MKTDYVVFKVYEGERKPSYEDFIKRRSGKQTDHIVAMSRLFKSSLSYTPSTVFRRDGWGVNGQLVNEYVRVYT